MMSWAGSRGARKWGRYPFAVPDERRHSAHIKHDVNLLAFNLSHADIELSTKMMNIILFQKLHSVQYST